MGSGACRLTAALSARLLGSPAHRPPASVLAAGRGGQGHRVRGQAGRGNGGCRKPGRRCPRVPGRGGGGLGPRGAGGSQGSQPPECPAQGPGAQQHKHRGEDAAPARGAQPVGRHGQLGPQQQPAAGQPHAGGERRGGAGRRGGARARAPQSPRRPAPPPPPQYFVQVFPVVEEHVRRSMGEELYQLFLVSAPPRPQEPRPRPTGPPPRRPSPGTHPLHTLGRGAGCWRDRRGSGSSPPPGVLPVPSLRFRSAPCPPPSPDCPGSLRQAPLAPVLRAMPGTCT